MIDDNASRGEPCTGEIWQHFKGGQYAIAFTAINATNGGGGKYVVYKKINPLADEWYVRELGEFMSAVDTEKYPDAAQKWRFEKTELDFLTGDTPYEMWFEYDEADDSD